MSKSTNSLVFPDINVWFAVTLEEHLHHAVAKTWWQHEESPVIAFSRFTQLGLLRLLTTAQAMNGKPLTMHEAWKAYDVLFQDDRVILWPEPDNFDAAFRPMSSLKTSSPKLWADAYLLAFVSLNDGTLVTFDRGCQNKGSRCRLLE